MDGDDLTLESIVARDISSMKTLDESIQEAEKTSKQIEKPRVEQLKFKQKVDAIETRKEFIMDQKKFNRRKKPTQMYSNHHLNKPVMILMLSGNFSVKVMSEIHTVWV